MNRTAIFRAARRILPGSVVAVAAALSLRRLDDFDTWWHLAAGRWIVNEGSVPSTDTLSFTVPDHAWTNLQWLYDVCLYALYSVGGETALVVAAAAGFTIAIWLCLRVALLKLEEVPAALLTLWGVLVLEERFIIRPEMVSFPLLALTIWLLVTAGRDSGRRLWMLAPLMVVWVNSHSLFVIGMAAIGGVTVGVVLARRLPVPEGWRNSDCWTAETERRLLIAAALSAAATLLNPFLIEGALFPLHLMSRIDGSNSVFQAIGEFRRPFSNYFTTFSITAYQSFFFATIGILVAASVAAAGRRRRRDAESDPSVPGFDIGLALVFAALAYLSLLARRNIGIFAVGAIPIAALALSAVVDRLPRKIRASLHRLGDFAAPVIVAFCVLLVGTTVTNKYYRWSSVSREFGVGTFETNFPIHAADFASRHELPGRVYNDLTAGGYLTWGPAAPGGVFIDGRLEVYDTEFFSAYMQGLSNPRVWAEQAEKYDINTVVLFHRWGNRHRLIHVLRSDPRWTLVYFDEVAIVFVRTAGNEVVIDRAAKSFPQWRDRTEQRLTSPVNFWQEPIERTLALESYAALLQVVGLTDDAIATYERMLTYQLVASRESRTRFRTGLLLARRGARNQALMHLRRAAELDPKNSRIAQTITELGG